MGFNEYMISLVCWKGLIKKFAGFISVQCVKPVKNTIRLVYHVDNNLPHAHACPTPQVSAHGAYAQHLWWRRLLGTDDKAELAFIVIYPFSG